MDGRKKNGAKKGEDRGQGRKKKVDEQLLVEKLSPMDDEANEILFRNMRNDESWAVKMWFDRRWGKVSESQQIDMNLNSFSLKDMDGMSHTERIEALKNMGL